MNKYYRLDKILSYGARYNIIFGERSNGKTFACLEYGLEQFVKDRTSLAIVRRWGEDFRGKRGQTMFDALSSAGVVKKLTKGEWTDIYYWSSRWYLCRYDESGKRETMQEPFAYGFSLTDSEHDKSTSYPTIRTVVFDEFITRRGYVDDEFVLFMNVLSTIIRQRDDVKIFMLGNTVNKFCPYFNEMGLTHLKQMKPGNIDLYQYGNGNLKLAVEYTLPTVKGKASDVYFAFDNPKLSMITGGAWEIDIYPHSPCKYLPKEIKFTYFIEFDGQTLQADIVKHNGNIFTFIHPKTTPLKHPDKDIIFSTAYDPRPNWRRNILKPYDEIGKRITQLIATDKVYYSSNDVGDVMFNYLKWCK